MRLPAVVLLTALSLAAQTGFDAKQADRFAQFALDCVHKQYPNKIAHSLNSDADVKPPRELTPAFYGCYDWHSSVHGHWLLVRSLRLFPGGAFAPAARAALGQSLTPGNIAREVDYLVAEGRSSFERPYGLAWLLQLSAELKEWDDPEARKWHGALEPLAKAAVARVSAWLPKLQHPVRTGEHNNTALGLGLMLDYARSSGEAEFGKLLAGRVRDYYLKDRACPITYEPSGEDFVSPCLAEADVMRRVLSKAEFVVWFRAFLRHIPLESTPVSDFSDGKLGHLAGLNLSRAWMLEGIVSVLGSGGDRSRMLELSGRMRATGLESIRSEQYEGGHWLGSFAVYLVSGRGLN